MTLKHLLLATTVAFGLHAAPALAQDAGRLRQVLR